MPHLHFNLSFTPSPEKKQRFTAAVVDHFARVTDTGTDHIAVSLACGTSDDLRYGRAVQGGIAFLDADLRRGRTAEQKRAFALAVIRDLESMLGVPPPNVYVTFTEHDGPDFQMHDGVLPSWSPGEDPLAHVR
jgi:phenylpyruvate tautomerase PptA (4-oxalocrotonate tautomerase family)